MPISCPICGLGERCRNHWIAEQRPDGEIEFQVGPMTASEDNLVMLRNKLKNPALKELMLKLQLKLNWVESDGRILGYLEWPLELRGAVHRALFPAGAPGSERPIPPTPVYDDLLEDLGLRTVRLDLENSLPDELLYWAEFNLKLTQTANARFAYMQTIWAEGVDWPAALATPALRDQAVAVIRLMLEGLVDPLRESFCGRAVRLLADEHPEQLPAGGQVDEVVACGEQDLHLGEALERLANQRRLAPLLRDTLLGLAISAKATAVN